jgi:hypothetical protein
MCVDSTYFPIYFLCVENTVFTYCAPVAVAPLQLFGGRGLFDKKCTRHYRINHLTSINVKIERPDDGNVLIAQQIPDI